MVNFLGKRISIVYFSGTGGTARAAACFEKLLKERGLEAVKTELRFGIADYYQNEDMLVLLYPVYAFDAPLAVYEWIDNISEVHKIPAAIISVSGGGEICPNTACRMGSIKGLAKKGYEVVYENMLVMPSNFIVRTDDPWAGRLLQILPKKIDNIINDLSNGTIRRTRPGLIDRAFAALGKLEKAGAKSFGKRIKVNNSCNSCGLCERSCPRSNIALKNGKPEFSNRCAICLKCLYGCPNRALTPGVCKFFVIKEGFSLNAIEKRMIDIKPGELPKGFLWKGLREYLLDG